MEKSWKPASACRFTFVLLFVLATTALLVSVSNADEPAAQNSGQTVVKPLPAAPAKNSVAAQKQLSTPPGGAVQATAPKTEKPVAAKPAQPPTPVAQKPPAVPVKPNGADQATAPKTEKPVAAKPAQPPTPVAQKPPAVPVKPNAVVQATAPKTEKPVAAKPAQPPTPVAQKPPAVPVKPNAVVQVSAPKTEKPVAAKPAQPPTPVAQKPPAVPPKPNGVIPATAQKVAHPVAAKPVAAKPAAANPVKALNSAPKAPALPGVRQASTQDAVKALQTYLGKKHAEEPKEAPEEFSAVVKRTAALLAAPKFSFIPDKALDPFIPFVSLQPATATGAPGSVPLTPLQRMTMAEIERGLKAIVWGALGRMAVIEDSTGKGFIVGVGTPAGPNGGVITRVQDDCLVIQQEIWNSRTKKRTPENFTVKLVKKDNRASF
jgi:hypothetical protein